MPTLLQQGAQRPPLGIFFSFVETNSAANQVQARSEAELESPQGEGLRGVAGQTGANTTMRRPAAVVPLSTGPKGLTLWWVF